MKQGNIYFTIILLLFARPSGFAQQEKDSLALFTTQDVVGLAVPAALITYGLLSLGDNGIREWDYTVRDALLDRHAPLRTGLDHYLQFSPALLAFGLKAAGVKSRHSATDMALLYALSNVVNGAMVHGTRLIAPRTRPDGSKRPSFPSGHTSTAFVAAEFLHQEYADGSVWLSVGGYGLASLIGVARIAKNRHWVSDVVAGAGMGILSTQLVYWAYPQLQRAIGRGSKTKTGAVLFPCYTDGRWGVGLACTF
jgi:membrane-associated phospholipid phosphatase